MDARGVGWKVVGVEWSNLRCCCCSKMTTESRPYSKSGPSLSSSSSSTATAEEAQCSPGTPSASGGFHAWYSLFCSVLFCSGLFPAVPWFVQISDAPFRPFLLCVSHGCKRLHAPDV